MRHGVMIVAASMLLMIRTLDTRGVESDSNAVKDRARNSSTFLREGRRDGSPMPI